MGRQHPEAEVVVTRHGVEVASWPLRPTGRPDLAVVDHLARLQLEARRSGYAIFLRRTTPALAEVLALAGLDLRVEVIREPEGGEQAGVDEVVMGDDASA